VFLKHALNVFSLYMHFVFCFKKKKNKKKKKKKKKFIYNYLNKKNYFIKKKKKKKKKKKTSKVEAWMGWQNLSSAKMGHLGLNLKKNQNYKVA